MSEEEFEAVERFVLRVVQSRAPISPDRLFELADDEPERYSASVVSDAMWQLLSAGELGFTKNWQLTAS